MSKDVQVRFLSPAQACEQGKFFASTARRCNRLVWSRDLESSEGFSFVDRFDEPPQTKGPVQIQCPPCQNSARLGKTDPIVVVVDRDAASGSRGGRSPDTSGFYVQRREAATLADTE